LSHPPDLYITLHAPHFEGFHPPVWNKPWNLKLWDIRKRIHTQAPWSGSRRLRLPEFIGSRHMVVCLSALRTGHLDSPGDTPGIHFCYRPDGLRQWKIRITLSGIERATFRLVAHCATACSVWWYKGCSDYDIANNACESDPVQYSAVPG
jgi:hypothetical protein